jgi:chromosome segregation ATPase
MNDFETVALGLSFQGHAEAKAALDRIEAKMNACHELHEMRVTERDEAKAEVERLQAQVKHATIDYDDARSRVFDAEAGLTKWHDAWLKAEAEVERLQREVARLAGWRVPDQEEAKELIEGVAEHYKAEVERLRNDESHLRLQLADAERTEAAEILRLARLDAAEWRKAAEALGNEKDLLRKHYPIAADAVERLARAALAEEKYDPGPGPEWERGPNMKDVG